MLAMIGLPLLAFGFASPWLLWGLGAAAAPILIHLLYRRRHREMTWAAMRFLTQAVRKNARRLRLHQWLLLAVRTLILILVAMALARPTVDSLGAYFRADQPTHRIIVLDASYSMGRLVGDETVFDRARQIAKSIAEGSHQGDALQLVRLSNLPPQIIIRTPSYQSSAVAAEIDTLTLPHGLADLTTGLSSVLELTRDGSTPTRKEIYLLSDFQQRDWQGTAGDESARLHELLRQLDLAAHLVLIDVGQNETSQRSVTQLAALEQPVTIGQPVRLRCTIRNHGNEAVSDLPLELKVDGKLIEQRRVSLAAGADLSETFLHRFPISGEHRIQVSLPADLLPIDDQRWLSLPVRDRLRVLLVNGRSAGTGLGRATDYLALALQPRTGRTSAGASVSAASVIEPELISEGELSNKDLTPYDCIFLCDVALFTEREAQQLETYIKSGGGVIWTMGDQVRIDAYNSVLYRDGQGILPARLLQRVGDLDKRSSSFEFDASDLSHPLVQVFEGNPDAGLETTRTTAYLKVQVSGDAARIPLRFDSKDPVFVEQQIGLGRSILIATSVDDRWGAWPLWPSFLPMMQEVVLYAVTGRSGERQHLVGQPIVSTLRANAGEAGVLLQRPDQTSRPVSIIRTGSLPVAQSNDTELAGMYELQIGGVSNQTELHAVNVDPREGDLRRASQPDLETELLAGLNYEWLTEWTGRSSSGQEAPVSEGNGLSRWLLYAAIYLVLVEQMLAWKPEWGVWLLCPVLLPIPLLRIWRQRTR